jgi:preprotein translocase subunit SecB
MSDQQPVFQIEKLYVKDLSLELPNAPQCFLERESPQIEVQMNTTGSAVSDGIFDVTLKGTVTAKIGDKTIYLIEAAQAGVFRMENIPEAELGPLLAIGCPTILFPYLREVISDGIVRGGFPPLILAPVNFEALYQQQAAQQAAAQSASGTPQ